MSADTRTRPAVVLGLAEPTIAALRGAVVTVLGADGPGAWDNLRREAGRTATVEHMIEVMCASADRVVVMCGRSQRIRLACYQRLSAVHGLDAS